MSKTYEQGYEDGYSECEEDRKDQFWSGFAVGIMSGAIIFIILIQLFIHTA